jgi:hypothetical protein
MSDAIRTVTLLLLAVLAIATLGFAGGAKFVCRQAVDAGAAHWECDPATGCNTFVWDGKKTVEKGSDHD